MTWGVSQLFFCDARVSRARFIREKHVFGGGRKTRFSRITFFLVDLRESGQSKVCRASDTRNFDTKFVGIETVWPRFCPDRKFPRLGPIVFSNDLQLLWLGRLSWFWCQSTGKCPAECPSYRYESDPGPSWPAMARQTQKWPFLGVFGFFDN